MAVAMLRVWESQGRPWRLSTPLVDTVSSLKKAITDYQAEYATNTRQAQLEAARAALAGLHPDDLVTLLKDG